MKTRGWPKTTTAWMAIATVVQEVQLATAIAALTGSTVGASNQARSRATRTTRAPSAVLSATATFEPLPLPGRAGDVPSAGAAGGAAAGGGGGTGVGGGRG